MNMVVKRFSIEEVEALLKEENLKEWDKKRKKEPEYNIELCGYQVYMLSLRYKTFFEKGYKCATCNREGAYFLLETTIDNPKRAHFNLYSADGVLMTKDHIYPKSLGGKDKINNLQTMCTFCNEKKGALIEKEN